jgi:hypothetical protein
MSLESAGNRAIPRSNTREGWTMSHVQAEIATQPGGPRHPTRAVVLR